MNSPRIYGWTIVLASLTAAAQVGAQAAAGSDTPVRFNQLGGAAGLNQYMPQAWGVVGVSVANQEDQPVDVLAAFAFSRDPDVQFARRIWVPPRAERRTWVPVKTPRLPRSQETVACYGMLIEDRSGAEVVLRDSQAEVQHSSLLRVNHNRPVTGVLVGDEAPDSDSDDPDYAYEAVIALRTSRGHKRGLALIRARDLPPLRDVLDGLDQLVLWDDCFADDVAILTTLRAWLNDGGSLWIMLDRVDFAGVERLLGETFTCQLVNRVALDQVAIESAEPLHPTAAAAAAESYEQPLDFARVIVTDMQVTHKVQGWPAAFWRPVGRGRVVFTTLGAQAWICRATAQRTRWDPERMTDFEPKPVLEELPLIQARTPPLGRPELFRDYLAERIGYRIASRGPVSAILGLFCAGLLLAGVVLARRRRLEHLAWISPGLALLAAVPLAGLGWRSQRTIPATVGQAQFLEVAEGADQVTASGLLACYDPAPAMAAAGARLGGVFEPEATPETRTTRRMVWTDLDQWHWENLRLTAGLRMAPFHWSSDLPERLEVRGTFAAEGFVAHWTGKTLALADAVLAVPGQPCLAVRAEGPRLLARPGDVLARGRYVEDRWLSDEQRRRQAVSEQMLRPEAEEVRELPGPLLLGWSDAVDMGFQFPRHQAQFGTALWSLPLKIDRPAGGTSVVIPSPFLPFAAVNRPTTENQSSLYDRRTGVWIPSQKPTETWLRFQVPAAVLPLRIERARLMLQITAPSRTVQIVRRAGERTQPLHTADNPIGQVELTLDGATLPELDAAGRLLLGLLVGATADEGAGARASVWKIDSVQLEIAGQVLPDTRE